MSVSYDRTLVKLILNREMAEYRERYAEVLEAEAESKRKTSGR